MPQLERHSVMFFSIKRPKNRVFYRFTETQDAYFRIKLLTKRLTEKFYF